MWPGISRPDPDAAETGRGCTGIMQNAQTLTSNCGVSLEAIQPGVFEEMSGRRSTATAILISTTTLSGPSRSSRRRHLLTAIARRWRAPSERLKRRARVAVVSKPCRHPGCQLAGVKFCRCFGRKVVRRPSYVVWATPTHPSSQWAVGHEIRPGCPEGRRLCGVEFAGGRAGKAAGRSLINLGGSTVSVDRPGEACKVTLFDTGVIPK
jgi:hypothetical protein